MKITELKKAPKNKIGKLNKNGVDLKPHEERTAELLTLYGFNVEAIRPSNIPKIKNPDILMMGTVWEMKGPTNSNASTIKKRFRKSIKQANGKGIFDLRNIKTTKEQKDAFDTIIELFETSRGMRRIIIIEDSDKVLDIFK